MFWDGTTRSDGCDAEEKGRWEYGVTLDGAVHIYTFTMDEQRGPTGMSPNGLTPMFLDVSMATLSGAQSKLRIIGIIDSRCMYFKCLHEPATSTMYSKRSPHKPAKITSFFFPIFIVSSHHGNNKSIYIFGLSKVYISSKENLHISSMSLMCKKVFCLHHFFLLLNYKGHFL